MRVLLTGHLLFRRQDRLDRAEVDVNHPRVRTLLDHACDDVALATLELPQDVVVRDVAQPLVDDLFGRESPDPTEVARAVLPLADNLAVVVQLRHEDAHVPVLAVQGDACRRCAILVLHLAGVLEVGRENRLLDDHDQFLEGNFTLALHETQHAQIDVH